MTSITKLLVGRNKVLAFNTSQRASDARDVSGGGEKKSSMTLHMAEQKCSWWTGIVLADCHRLPAFSCLTVDALPLRHYMERGVCVALDPPSTNGRSHSPEDWSFSATHSLLVPLLFSSTNRSILAGSLTVCTGTYHWVKRYASSKFRLRIWLFFLILRHLASGWYMGVRYNTV